MVHTSGSLFKRRWSAAHHPDSHACQWKEEGSLMNTTAANDLTSVSDPLTDTERRLATLWCEVLQCREPPLAKDNFFSLGGDSVALTMLLFRVHQEFGLDLPPVTI